MSSSEPHQPTSSASVYAPTVDGASLEPSAQPAPLGPPRSLEGVRVLVVEDEPDSREVLTELLEFHGASVRTAASAAEAVAEFEAASPDLVVSDIAMPGEDGFSLMRKLRAREGQPRFAAAALSAFSQKVDRERALAAGFDAYVAKPMRPEYLVQVVSRLVAAMRTASA